MMSKRWATGFSIAMGIALIFLSTGCGSSSALRTNSSSFKQSISPNLVLPGDEMSYAEPQNWEYSRNDQRLSVGREMPATHVDKVEIRLDEQLRNHDGRPHNHSTTRIRSIRRKNSP